jgi:hypothetical protein
MAVIFGVEASRRKRFFFEKKNQKTSVIVGVGSGEGLATG